MGRIQGQGLVFVRGGSLALLEIQSAWQPYQVVVKMGSGTVTLVIVGHGENQGDIHKMCMILLSKCCCFVMKNTDQIGSQFCTCHGSRAAVTCTEL